MAHELESRADIRYLFAEKCESSMTCESVVVTADELE
jgi:hypothetical protein